MERCYGALLFIDPSYLLLVGWIVNGMPAGSLLFLFSTNFFNESRLMRSNHVLLFFFFVRFFLFEILFGNGWIDGLFV